MSETRIEPQGIAAFTRRMDGLTIPLTLDEAIAVVAALRVAGDPVSRWIANAVDAKINAAIEAA